ncbi:MAG: SDR family oxidoreductase [Myxococcota bacterium]|nr:SDR family oxidoreductase [Myxococcota bacterium]
MSKRTLVTGGAGFLGSHLCDRLLALGHEVVALDNFYTGDRRNVAHLAGEARFTLVEHDVTAPYPELGGRFDWIFNLACPASPPHYQRDPVFTSMTSVLGTKHGLERAERDGARFFQASTSEVYGDPEVHPQPESYRGCVNPLGPRACYDEGKRMGESLCMDFHRSRGVDIRIVRIFNTYGPRMDPKDGRVVSNFIVQALAGKPLTIYGDGSQTRSFCYVDDLLDGFLKLMEHPTEIGPVNVGTEYEFSMLDLAREVGKAVRGEEPVIEKRPLPADDPTQRRPDLTKARSVLGFEPRVTLEDGLKRTVAYFARRMQEGGA